MAKRLVPGSPGDSGGIGVTHAGPSGTGAGSPAALRVNGSREAFLDDDRRSSRRGDIRRVHAEGFAQVLQVVGRLVQDGESAR